MEGKGVNGLVVRRKEKKALLKKHAGTHAWTSFIECISADSRALPPGVIFRSKTVQTQWFPIDKRPFQDW
jgi:hypothetical protein